MRIAIATVQVPFVRGGAECLAEGLQRACRNAGHQAEILTHPFRFGPNDQVRRSIEFWDQEDLDQLEGREPDLVICLKFPAYYLHHPNKNVWLLHQHRAAYELRERATAHGHLWSEDDQALCRLIHHKDNQTLGRLPAVYTISTNVSERLRRYNGIDSRPLYHPPALAGQFYSAPVEPFIFFPSRLEPLKRQRLLIEAMAHVRSPVRAVVAGTGSDQDYLNRQIQHLGLGGRVQLVGNIDDRQLLDYYARCLGVFFGPEDEDYGYVTLEAMLAAKPVITCHDSGGPLEFVVAGETGWVVLPHPRSVAEAIDGLYDNRQHAAWMGEAGQERYRQLDISWDNVLQELLY